MEMVQVPAGRYQMGDTFGDGHSREQPVHEVRVEAFWLGKYPVTQGQWQAVMGNNPSEFQKGDDYPVENVSWDEVQEFISKLNRQSGKGYRLPSESEWEYAARSGGKAEKWSGTSEASSLGEYACFDHNSDLSTHPVGQKKPNGLGLYDMAGNVWEWCQDWWHDDYKGAPEDGSVWAPGCGAFRVSRGGSWSNVSKRISATNRNRIEAGYRYNSLGFRLLLPVL